MTVKVFSVECLNLLVTQAKNSPRLRQHSNIHLDYADPCQRLFNSIEPDSYIRPHRHRIETLFAIRGLMALVAFNNDGAIEGIQRFGIGSSSGALNIAAGIEIPSDKWHTVVSLASGSILLEIKAGPFDPNMPKSLAPWAPDEGTPDGANYLKQLMEKIN
jgi:cupin fold WbuC family metalloprotein